MAHGQRSRGRGKFIYTHFEKEPFHLKIPLYPPFPKGELMGPRLFPGEINVFPPLVKGGEGGRRMADRNIRGWAGM